MEESIAWTIISVLPICLFFILFFIIGGIRLDDSTNTNTTNKPPGQSKLKLLLLYIGLANKNEQHR